MKINYELILIDYSAKSAILEGNYIKIIGLDDSTTKIHIKYIPKKYIIEE